MCLLLWMSEIDLLIDCIHLYCETKECRDRVERIIAIPKPLYVQIVALLYRHRYREPNTVTIALIVYTACT